MFHINVSMAYDDDTSKSVELIKDDKGGFRYVMGTYEDWEVAKKLPKVASLLTTLGFPTSSEQPAGLVRYVFRFHSLSTNGQIDVLGSSDNLESGQVVTNNLLGVIGYLEQDDDFQTYVVGGIETVLARLNAQYSLITDFIPNFYRFTDDYRFAYDEFGNLMGEAPLGDVLVRLSSGKLIWAGITGGDVIGGYNIRRYNADYTLDDTWNPPIIDETGNNGFVRHAAEQSDGKLIVVGRFATVNDGVPVYKIMRLNTDGTLDITFNEGGTGFGTDLRVNYVHIEPDDSILVAGAFTVYNGDNVGKLIRLNPDGSRDVSFDPPHFNDIINALEVLENGDIVVVGWFDKHVKKISNAGVLDDEFETNIGTGFNSRAFDIKRDSSGKFIIGGWFSSFNGDPVKQVVRMNTDGTLDPGFSMTGSLLSGSMESVMSVDIYPDDKVAVGGWFNTLDDQPQSKIIKLNSDGTQDTSFDIGEGFNLMSDFWNGSRINAVVANPDGSMLATGNVQSYDGTPVNGFAKLSPSGVLEDVQLLKYKTIGIDDGTNDMYDGSNYINTNLTQSYDTITDTSIDYSLCIPYTHTTTADSDAWQIENISVYNPLSDGSVADGSQYFGPGSKYFTNMYPGMFVMVAQNISIEEFCITGNLGSDGNTDLETLELTINGDAYSCFIKTNIEDGGSDPTVNHIILVPGPMAGLTRIVNVDGEDKDDDCIRGLTGRDSIYYLLVSTADAVRLSFDDAIAIAEKFVQVAL